MKGTRKLGLFLLLALLLNTVLCVIGYVRQSKECQDRGGFMLSGGSCIIREASE